MRKIFSIILLAFLFQHVFSQNKTENFSMILHDDWRMQSSVTDKTKGAAISAENFAANSWYPITVPSTIIAGLLANHVYNFDPFYGTILKSLLMKNLIIHGGSEKSLRCLHQKKIKMLCSNCMA